MMRLRMKMNYHAITKTKKSGVQWPHTFVSLSAFSRRAVVSYWRKYVHEVLVNRLLGGLSLSRKSVLRLPDRPDMPLDVCCGRKPTNQQQQQLIQM